MTLWFQKWHEELVELSLEHSKAWKVVLWWALFVQSICFSWKISEVLCFMTLKGDAKFKTDTCLKNDIRNSVNFYESSRKSENLHFDGFVLSKAYKVLDEKVQKSYFSWHWSVIQRKANSWEICIFCVMQWTWSS